MNSIKLVLSKAKLPIPSLVRFMQLSSAKYDENMLHYSELTPDLLIAKRKERKDESLEQKKSRLTYQSRKRGMLENDLLLSTFASKYLGSFNEEQTDEYDRLINEPSNDWDLYYWATEAKTTPPEYESKVMKLFKEHVKNPEREERFFQPELK